MKKQSQTPGAIGSNNPKRGKKTIVIGAVILLTAAAIGIYYFYQNNKQTSEQSESSQGASPESVKPTGVDGEAKAKIALGDYDGAQKVTTDAINSAKNDEEKYEYFMLAAGNAMSARKYPEALDYASKAIALNSTYQANRTAGDAALAANNKVEARKYYQAALEKLDTESPTYEAEKGHLENDIRRAS